MTRRVVIVGSSVAGVSTADALRQAGFGGRILVVGAEDRLPYDRPPLSKGVLTGELPAEKTLLRDAGHYDRRQIELRLGVPAVELRPESGELRLGDGTSVEGDIFVIATGASPRRLAGQEKSDPLVLTLRTLTDSTRLQTFLSRRITVAVVGGGFIGAEVASSAVKVGAEVTMVEAERLPLLRRLGTEVATALAEFHRAAGVVLRTGMEVRGVERAGERRQIHCSGGTQLQADLVVLGLGVTPNISWLYSSGIELADGVLCDRHGRTTARNVYAVGDVAAWETAGAGDHRRVEHWTNAKEQAKVVAANIVAGVEPVASHDPLPYVWSDQHGSRIQILGDPAADDEVTLVHGSLSERAFAAVYVRDERVTGAVGRDSPAVVMRYRNAVRNALPFDVAARLKQVRIAS